MTKVDNDEKIKYTKSQSHYTCCSCGNKRRTKELTIFELELTSKNKTRKKLVPICDMCLRVVERLGPDDSVIIGYYDYLINKKFIEGMLAGEF
jgi:hypothetical protein